MVTSATVAHCGAAPHAAGLRALRQSALFSDLPDDMLKRLATVAPVQPLSAGTLVYDIGCPATDMFVLIDGQVDRMVGETAYSLLISSVSGCGAVFGATCFGTGSDKRLTAARCATDCLLIRVSRTVLDGLVAGDAALSARISQRLVDANRRLLRELSQVLEEQAREIARVKGAFEERLNLEQLLTLFVSNFINLEPPFLDSAIQSSLVLLANYFTADQLAVYVTDMQGQRLHRRFGWTSETLPGGSHLPDTVTVGDLPVLWGILSDYGSVVADRLDDLPPTATVERAALAARGVQSVMTVPMVHHSTVAGLLVIETTGSPRQWPAESVSLMRILGEAILHAQARKQLDESLHRMAHYDQLTGLANRTLYRDLLVKAIARARRAGDQVALMYLDLDRFKWVNDSLGHIAGDTLLKVISQRLRSCVRECDTVSRLGGDEFTIIMEGLQSQTGAVMVAEKVLTALRRPFVIDGQEIRATTSIGIATFPTCGDDPDALTQYADMAMYKAKEAGRGTYRFFSPALNDMAQHRLALESSLQRALERSELELFCQPQVSAVDGRMVGAEALVRWRCPERGMVSPGEFLPVAEDTGLIVPMSEWILTEAGRQRLAWNGSAAADARIAVNVTGRWLKDDNFVRAIDQLLENTGLPPRSLELELTEEILLSDAQESAGTLHALRDRGIEIALDDFGTGYSSLSYLRTLPIDLLKIDQSFVRNLENSRNDAAIVSAMISLAHNLDLRVVAEGVETEAQNRFLREAGCDIIQGYLISEPQPQKDFLAWMTAAGGDATVCL